MKSYVLTSVAAVIFGVIVAGAFAQTPAAARQDPISVADLRTALGDPITVTATVAAVDYDSRVVVLRDQAGVDYALYVGDDVRRFSAIKVGDRIKATYYMSLASRILRPGEAATTGVSEGVVGTTGVRPGGIASAQQKWVVRVDAVNEADKTVTVTGEKDRTFTFKVEDASGLSTVKPGDRIEVTLTAALLINVEPGN